MQDAQNEIKINVDQAQIYQAQRLLNKIETASLTTEYQQALNGLVKRYFYMNYDNCSRQFARFIITNFKFDLTHTQIVCTKSDNLVASELKNDISSTFKIILYKAVDYRTYWEKISGKIEPEINIIKL
jgi:hypothetical protein